jgi:hypothetical protein
MDGFINIIRNIFAIVVGVIVGMTFNMLFGFINTLIFPLPEGMSYWDMFDEEKFQEIVDWIGTLPQSAFILVLVAHLSQAFFGGYVAAFISKRNVMCVAMVVGALSLVAGLMNMAQMPAPLWLWIEMPLYLLVAWYAGKLELKRRKR